MFLQRSVSFNEASRVALSANGPDCKHDDWLTLLLQVGELRLGLLNVGLRRLLSLDNFCQRLLHDSGRRGVDLGGRHIDER